MIKDLLSALGTIIAISEERLQSDSNYEIPANAIKDFESNIRLALRLLNHPKLELPSPLDSETIARACLRVLRRQDEEARVVIQDAIFVLESLSLQALAVPKAIEERLAKRPRGLGMKVAARLAMAARVWYPFRRSTLQNEALTSRQTTQRFLAFAEKQKLVRRKRIRGKKRFKEAEWWVWIGP